MAPTQATSRQAPYEAGDAYRERPHPTNGRADPLLGLVAGLVHDVTTLFRQESELVRLELSEKLDQARSGMKAFSAGMLLVHAGALILLVGVALGLDIWIERPWLSFLCVGATVAVIGAALLARGQHELSTTNLTPSKSAESLRKDGSLLRDEVRRD